MPPLDVLKNARSDTVIPDCCNIGVIFRVLLAVNASVLVAALLHSAGWMAALLDFVESAMIIELSCLLSLLSLCGLRTLPAVRTLQQWAQRALCGLVPAILTAAIVYFFSAFEWFTSSFTHLTVTEGMLLAALFGIASQHYFELRARAFSPALTEARLQALQARIRPHFLFNSLNGVLGVLRANPRRAEEGLEELADLFRALMQENRDLVPLADEITLCERYLNLERLRLGERLDVRWNRDPRADEALVPPLFLQPLVENAVYHGIEPGAGPGTVSITIQRRGPQVLIEIANPVLDPLRHHAGNRMALDNIRERLMLFYDLEATLDTEQGADAYCVRIRLPFRCER